MTEEKKTLSRGDRAKREVELKRHIDAGLTRLVKSEKTDNQEMRRKIALDECCIRLSRSGEFVLKGAHALEMRSRALDEQGCLSRATKDVDFLARLKIPEELLREDGKGMQHFIAARVQSALEIDVEEELAVKRPTALFRFEILEITRSISAQGGASGVTIRVAAKLAQKNFEAFQVDVVVGDALWEGVESLAAGHIAARALTGQMESATEGVDAIRAAQHFAEKLHAYSLPREKENSRDKDLIDMFLFIRRHSLAPTDALAAARHVFEFRKTHELPDDLDPPPASWEVRFAGRAKECGVEMSMAQAFGVVREFWAEALASGS
jgi:Nucleotidyl transferase AbiEii toxin, Type IV TA system